VTVVWRGRGPGYANDRAAGGGARDSDGRLALQVLRGRRAEGPEAFRRWLALDPIGWSKRLADLLASTDPRVRRGAAVELLTQERETLTDLAALTPAEAAEVERWNERREDAGHGQRRAMDWRAGLTVRQGRARRQRACVHETTNGDAQSPRSGA
jgi:hypothetical protein